MGMTAYPSTTPTDAPVVISGNSSYTHGGGILCNGYLVVGQSDADDTLSIGKSLELQLNKELIDLAGKVVESLAGHDFVFEVRDGETGAATVVATGTSNADGSIVMNNRLAFGPKNCVDAVKLEAANEGAAASYLLSYYIRELDPTEAGIAKDESVYRLDVAIDEKHGTQSVSGTVFPKINYEIAKVELRKQTAGTSSWNLVSTRFTRTDEAHADYLAMAEGETAFTNSHTPAKKDGSKSSSSSSSSKKTASKAHTASTGDAPLWPVTLIALTAGGILLIAGRRVRA